jgi:glutamate-1-semialdehyde 2,1-aminomutase
MFSVLLGKETPPVDYRSYAEFDAALFGELGSALIERGVLVDDDPREPWFLSYSHDAAVIEETLQVVEDAVQSVFGGRALQHAMQVTLAA